MVTIAMDYMKRMGIENTQFIIGRHHDKQHPHIHILYNCVDFNGRTISDKNDRIRSTKICKEITHKYGLYMSSGKENVKRDRLQGKDKTKYLIYDSLVRNIPKSKSWSELQERLKDEKIIVGFKTKGSTDIIEGVRFTVDNTTFNGSKVDVQFSFSKINFALKQNLHTEQQKQYQAESSHHEQNNNDTSSVLGGLFDFSTAHSNDSEDEPLRNKIKKNKPQRKIRF